MQNSHVDRKQNGSVVVSISSQTTSSARNEQRKKNITPLPLPEMINNAAATAVRIHKVPADAKSAYTLYKFVIRTEFRCWGSAAVYGV